MQSSNKRALTYPVTSSGLWHRPSPRFAKTLIPILLFYLVYCWTRLPPVFDEIEVPYTYPDTSRALVIAATTSSNLSWVEPAIQNTDWRPNIYITDSPDAPLTVTINRGNEAMVYLTYIIDNYRNLPDVIFFHHDHEQAWHQIFSSADEVANLNVHYVVDSGYVSPRCLRACESVIEISGGYLPINDLEDSVPREIQIGSFLMEFLGWIPDKIAAPCCAQFAVSKGAVYGRSLDGWKLVRSWLEKTALSSSSSGRVLEYTWHLLFGMSPIQ
jgi:hypothetical protein